MTAAYVYTTREGDMLDHLCYQVYGVQEGAVEFVLSKNPNIRELPEKLERGVQIRFDPLPEQAPRRTVKLWD